MRRRFRTEHDDWIKPGELRPLLERLHAEDAEPQAEPDDDHTTVAAVCEATGESEHRVWQFLDQIRAEDLEGRLSERLREAEEPLYRVERPGISHDPLSTKSLTNMQKTFSSILDSVPRLGQPKPQRKKKLVETSHDHASKWISLLVLLMVVGLVLYIILRAMEKGLV